MHAMYSNKGRRDGYAYVTVFGVILMVAAFLIVGVRAGMQRAFAARQLSSRVRAQAIAEAGASAAYVQLERDFSLRTNAAAFAPTNYAGGSYSVTIIPVGDDMAVIESTGIHESMTETVILDTRRHERMTDPESDNAFGYAILADGQITWTGCGVFGSNSSVHANGQFKQSGSGELNAFVTSSLEVVLNGNSGEIDGDVTAPDVRGKTGKITGTITEAPVAQVSIPQIDLGPYYSEAADNGEVYEGDRTISSAYAPIGGILWVNGDLHLSGSTTYEGCFIATGGIHLSGSPTHTKVGGYPGFVSRDGGIQISGSGRWQGLVYAPVGDIDITGGGTVEGSVITGGDFKKAGSSAIFTYVDSVPVAPDEVVTDGVLCVSAWQR